MLSEHKFPVDVEGTIRYRGWKVVLACFGLAIAAWSVGFYGHGLYLVELRRLHQWPTALISSATSFYYLFSSFLMIFLDIPLKAIGPRNLAAVGVVLLALPLAALGKIVEPWQLFAAYFVMAFGWTATGLAGITSIVGPWFERRRGLAISLALNGASVAGIIATPLLVTSTATYGFDTAAEYMAGVIFLILLPAMLLLAKTSLVSASFSAFRRKIR